jgi:pyruvate dehydrogenase E1 component beta subunit
MRELSYSAAVREALAQLLREHPEVFLIGEDIGVYGGAFKTTAGFVHEFGPDRVIDTPISEAGFVSIAAGAALLGSRPIAEIMFMDFMALAFDGIINAATKWQEIYGPDYAMPLIVRAPAGAGRSYGPTHSQSFEGLLQNVPRLTIVCPSSPADAAALLLGAYELRAPVIFIEHKALYARKGPVPERLVAAPIGQAAILQPGEQLSLFAYGRHVPLALQAAQQLAAEGIRAEVVDLRTIKPLDTTTILDSIRRTGRGMSLEESPVIGGVGSEIAAVIMEQAFDCLEAPFTRLGAAEQAIPCSPRLEQACFPNLESVLAKARELAAY